MAGFRIEGATGNDVVVNAAGALSVSLPVDATGAPATIAAVQMFSQVDDGVARAAAPLLRSGEVSQDFRQRVGVDTLLFRSVFNATAQNISTWKHAFTTMTMTQSAGFLNVNAAGTSTVSGNYAYLQTWRYFQILGTTPLAVETSLEITEYPLANEVLHWGLGVAVAAAPPVDGTWFELTSAGLKGSVRYNSGTTVSVDLTDAVNIPLNTVRKYVSVVGERSVEFWINDALYGVIDTPAAQAQPYLSAALPYFIEKYNSGTIGSSPNLQALVGNVTVSLMDLATNQTWANQMANCGLGMQQLDGGAAGSPMVQWANTALPTAAAATNTTAALGAFLAGIFLMNAPATSATDVIVASWLNPVGGVNQTPRTIKLRGIKIDCVNSVVAVATTATTFAVALAWGGTGLSLAGTETGSFVTATLKGRRIQPLGVISFPVAAAVGAMATPLQFDFESPIVVNPGEYLQVIAKILVGTATATEVFQWIISPNLYHE